MISMRRTLALVFLASCAAVDVPALLTSCPGDVATIVVSSGDTGRIDQVDAKASTCLVPKILEHVASKAMKFVDVRRKDEFEAGHCKDAVNIVWDGDACWDNGASDPVCKQFIDDMTTFVDGDYTTPIFIHCVSGNRAGQVAMFLQGLDWKQKKNTYTDATKVFKNFVVSDGPAASICPGDLAGKGEQSMADLFSICGDGTKDSETTAGTITEVGKSVAACITPKIPSSAVFVDVRRVEEYSAGHCSNALNAVWASDSCWDFGPSDPACKAFIDQMTAHVTTNGVADYSKPVFIHCVSGNRSGQAALFLQGKNWKEKQNLYTDSTKFFTNIVSSDGTYSEICPNNAVSSAMNMQVSYIAYIVTLVLVLSLGA